MKKLLTILIFIFSCAFTKAQESVAGELSIWIDNNPYSKEITVRLQLISNLCWDENHNLTELFRGTSLSPTTYGWKEFYVCWSSDPLYYDSTFGLGRYKVSAFYENIDRTIVGDEFLIDYRTSDLPEAIGPGCQIDLAVDFDVSAAKFYYRGTQTEFPSSVNFWDIRTCVDNIKTGLEPLPPSNFQLSSSGGFPYLSWSHSTAGDYWTNFAIYRSVTSGCGSTPGNFSKIATVSGTTTSFTDYDFMVGGPITAHYKIAAVNGNRESDFSDIESICVGLYKEGTEQINYDYNLSQNYPNPFNPSTTINFSLKENSFVSLKVYDLLGREKATLVEGYKEAGDHSIEFNAQNLESGIYFYEIKADKFRNVKKLILFK